MVVDPDAIVNPWTVMVKTFYTFVTDAAVSGSIGSYDLAISAEENWVKDLHNFHERHTFRTFQVAWILAHRDQVEDHC